MGCDLCGLSFPVSMVGGEDVCEIFGGFDLLLGLDCGVGHSGEGVGLWWLREGLVEGCSGLFLRKNNNKIIIIIINENITINHM